MQHAVRLTALNVNCFGMTPIGQLLVERLEQTLNFHLTPGRLPESDD